MSNIIEEIKQEVAQERWLGLWKKYQNYVYGLVGAALIFSAASVWWNHQEAAKISAQSNDYTRALILVPSDPERAFRLFERIPSKGETIYAVLARFWVAALLLERGDIKGARDMYRILHKECSSIWASAKIKKFAELALLRGLYIDLDEADPALVINQAKPYTSKDSPWYQVGNELTALAYFKKGDLIKAKEYLKKNIAESNLSPVVKIRTQALLNYLSSTKGR